MTFRALFVALGLLVVPVCAMAQDVADRGMERPGDFALGAEDAPITLIEYASVACPHCASWHNSTWHVVKEDFVDTGRVRFVMREMITGSAPLALVGFMTARCAAEDRYFDAIDLLFTQQSAIFQAAQSESGARDEYVRIAGAVGLSEAEFEACLTNEMVRGAVIAAHEQAIADGIEATPSFVINNILVTTGHVDGAEGHVYLADGEPLRIDGELVLATQDADTFARIIEHFDAQDRD